VCVGLKVAAARFGDARLHQDSDAPEKLGIPTAFHGLPDISIPILIFDRNKPYEQIKPG